MPPESPTPRVRSLHRLLATLLLPLALVPTPARAGVASATSVTGPARMFANQAGDTFGASVAPAGDVNGDGYADVIVGAPHTDHGLTDQGAAFVYLGGPNGLASTPAWTAYGVAAGNQFGASVAGVGDVNGDGFDDVLVGEPYYDQSVPPFTFTDAGRALLFFGSDTGTVATAAWTRTSGQSGSYTGYSVTGGNDMNGDGRPDFAVGIPGGDGTVANSGIVYVFLGANGTPSTTQAATFNGSQASSFFGSSIDMGGDVNGDGLAELIVGAPAYDLNGSTASSGAYTLFAGSTGTLGTSNLTVLESQAGAQSGASVAILGDADGDGYAEYAVGAPTFDNGITDQGRVTVYRGSTGFGALPVLMTSDGTTTNQRHGTSVAAAGDVNGDGYADLIAGGPGFNSNTGRALLYELEPTPTASPLVLQSTTGASGDYLGQAVAAAGDVDGDGFGDVIVGRPGPVFLPGTLAGWALLWRGAHTPEMALTQTIHGAAAAAKFGNQVSMNGDFNGDGFADALVTSTANNLDLTVANAYLGGPNGLTTTPAWSLTGATGVIRRGDLLEAAGDVDGDGFDDVVTSSFDYANFGVRMEWFRGGAAGISATPSWSLHYPGAPYQTGPHPIGDVNGDGYADLAIHLDTYSTPAKPGAGAVEIHYGGPSGPAIGAGTTIVGPVSYDRLGIQVASAGDVNGDGYGDVVMLGEDSVSFTVHNRLQVHLGGPYGLSTTPVAVWAGDSNDPTTIIFRGLGIGDVNGDGYDDIAFGEAHDTNAPLASQFSRLRVAYGGPSGPSATTVDYDSGLGGTSKLDPYHFTGAMDLDGDGYSDIVYREYDPATTLYTLWRRSGGPTGLTAPVAIQSFGFASRPDDECGGDVDGDGFSDLITGHSAYNSNEGSINVFRSRPGALARPVTMRGSAKTVRLALHGRSDRTDGFMADVHARSAAGRVRLRLAIETKPGGVPFDLTGVTHSTYLLALGAPVDPATEIFHSVNGLAPGGAYRWRARVETPDPRHRYGHWLTMINDAWGGHDFKTSGGNLAADDPRPAPLALATPWPNPSRGPVRIAFTLPARGAARLELFDVGGRRVATPLDGTLDAGAHEVAWDGRSERGETLGAGLYFARLTTREGQRVTRIVRAR